MVIEGKGRPATQRLKSIDHNKTKSQHKKWSHQLLGTKCKSGFGNQATFLSATGHGIPAKSIRMEGEGRIKQT